jgi:hypothetical protein
MCPRSQPVRLNRTSSHPVRAVAAARVRVVRLAGVRVGLLVHVRGEIRVLLAPRGHRPAARRPSPVGVAAAHVAAADSPAAAGVVLHWTSQPVPRR